MRFIRCFRAPDLVVTAGAFVAIAMLTATGHENSIAATSAIIIPVYLAAANYERRRRK